ncbi:hypothetical protein SAMN02745664_10317 [Moraxella cuniculi DSM 21768]|uniref:2OG-Fe dioxygenase n=1 Tax=Moraxella cuniculi DSM 21768 TaxID=1122245 RepID=A0A1N7E260_9GAMM|nr:2OG-Fe dioxygenase family protein [Moraxella cuniculi]OOS04625.1 hypothetical protein B0189_08140 [Moraxella cuniculi]SIR82179.1 hypothetical protein SAMN02745664_10317 [Moraxella cuniculi DSM 21768]
MNNIKLFLGDIKQTYTKNRFVFINGNDMECILRFFGATKDDLDSIKIVSNSLADDPTLPFRKSKNGRFEINFQEDQVHRLKFQPFILSKEEDFVRYDSGMVRKFRGIGDDLQLNTAFQALLKFKSFMIQDVLVRKRPNLDYSANRYVSTVFNLRTITTPKLLGEPALEGVHSDGVDHTMTVLLDAKNLTQDSAITFVHDIREQNGLRYDECNPDYVLSQVRHTHFLDTLLIIDHERKHSLSPVFLENENHIATRDMLIFFTRKSTLSMHISNTYDSFDKHQELPISFFLQNELEKN